MFGYVSTFYTNIYEKPLPLLI